MRPQPRVQNKTKHTSKVTTVTPVSPGIPRAMVLTVSFVLSLVTGLVCHHRKRDAKHRRQLERQRRGVRTTRLRRPPHAPFVNAPPKRPPHPAPNVRDDRETPLERDGMAGKIG
jgi:hypothetical protein